MPRIGGVVGRLRNQPLLVAQAGSSAAGAAGIVVAAAMMTPRDFTALSLLTLVSMTAMGAVRAAVFQPALIEMRRDKGAHVSPAPAAVGAAFTGAVTGLAAFLFEVRDPLWLAAIAATSVLPVLSDWLRMRAMSLDFRWEVARGDWLRLAVTLLAPTVLWMSTSFELFFVFVNFTYITTFGYLWCRLPSVEERISLRSVWRPASSQLADYLVGQAVSTLPLLVFGALGDSGYIGGVRLAQTLLGPLNLLMAASASNLMSDGSTRESHAEDSDLIRESRRLAVNLTAVSFVLVAAILAFLSFSGLNLRGVDNYSLIVGVALVGCLALVSGAAGLDAFTLRLLGNHAIPTIGRVALVSATVCGYVVGFRAGGVDTSLVCGFVAATIANPIVFILPATLVYKRHGAADRSPRRGRPEKARAT